jgi:hypothetical protein
MNIIIFIKILIKEISRKNSNEIRNYVYEIRNYVYEINNENFRFSC